MNITVWELFKYLFKWKYAILAVTVLAFLGATAYVEKKQTYSAKVIIQYNDGCIGQGRTLDGGVFDSNEIKAPAVILKVLDDLGYENKKIDSVRENLSISAVTPTTVANLKTAKEKLGEEYQYFPKTFTITYKGNASFEATRDILSSVVANYFKYYSENYLYLATLNEVDYSLNKKNFDYLEQAEQLRDNLDQTITSLKQYAKDSAGYRSPTTGLTFSDLLKEFERINEYSISSIFAKIYRGQVTVDKRLLLNKYTERMESNRRDIDNLTFQAELAADRMDAYVGANVDVPNSYNSNINEGNDDVEIIEDVEWDRYGAVDEQTTYDQLIIDYANERIAANNKKIDAEYCQDVINRFSALRDPEINYILYETAVKEEIATILNELKVLYTQANINISDYNDYIPAMHLKKLSGIGYYENLSSALYKLIAIIGGLGLSAVGAIAYEIMKKYAQYGEDKKKENGEDSEDDKNGEEVPEPEEEQAEKSSCQEQV